MNNKKFTLSVVSVFVFSYIVDFLLHGVFLEEAYEATASLWRPESEIMGFLHLCLIVHIIFSIILVQFFRDFVLSKKKPLLHESLFAGLLVGEMVGVIQLASYIYMPMTDPVIAIGWFTGRVIQCVGSAYILYLINRK